MPILPEELFLEAVDKLVSIDRDWIPDGDGSLYLRPFMFANEIFLGVKPSSTTCSSSSPRRSARTSRPMPPAVSVWVSPDYTRAAPGGTGAAKCGGNYAASLLAQAEATQHGCDQVVFLDAVEQRWIEELGGMNIFFVFDDGSMSRHRWAARSCPASRAPRCSPWPRTRASRCARTAIRSTNGAPTPPAAASASPSPAAPPPSSRRSARSAATTASSRSATAARHQDRGIEGGSGRHPARARGRPARAGSTRSSERRTSARTACRRSAPTCPARPARRRRRRRESRASAPAT